eukprot:438249-Heterocapsa_arctica.AAC.1
MNTDPPPELSGRWAAKTASETINLMCLQPLGEPSNQDQEITLPPGSNSTYHDIPVPVSTQFTFAMKRIVECMIFPNNRARDMTEGSRTSYIPSRPTVGEGYGYLKE